MEKYTKLGLVRREVGMPSKWVWWADKDKVDKYCNTCKHELKHTVFRGHSNTIEIYYCKHGTTDGLCTHYEPFYKLRVNTIEL